MLFTTPNHSVTRNEGLVNFEDEKFFFAEINENKLGNFELTRSFQKKVKQNLTKKKTSVLFAFVYKHSHQRENNTT
jgi:hypothetical protein